MVVPALPALQRELDASTTWVTWVLTGFLLSASVLTPILGKLGDRFGKERLLVVSLATFLVGCIGCAAAPDIWTLIAFRMVSGAAGAIFPLSFGIIRDEFPPENASWRWLFVVGAVGVAIALVLVHRFVPESPVRSTSRIDVPGAFLMSLVLVSLLLGLSQGGGWGWTSPAVLGLFALSALGGVPPEIAERLGYGFAATATTTGLYLLPGSLLMLFAGPAAGLLGRRVGSKWPRARGMAVVAISATGRAGLHDEPRQIVVAMAGLSVGVGFAFAAMAALITEAVEPTETGIATGINTVMRTVGAVVGAQVGAAILTATTLEGTNVPTEGAYVTAFALAAVAAGFATVIAVFVTPPRRRRARSGVVVEAGSA